jgi:hypothetical protein
MSLKIICECHGNEIKNKNKRIKKQKNKNKNKNKNPIYARSLP